MTTKPRKPLHVLVKRPCPFCGEPPDRIGLEQMGSPLPFIDTNDVYWMECWRCGAQGPASAGVEDAAEQWDRRA